MWAGSTERAEDRPARALGVRGLPGAGLVAEHLFRSLDFVYVPTEDVDEAARRWVEELGAELLWKVHAMGTVVAQLRVSEDGPAILLSGHLDGDVPILLFHVLDASIRTRALASARESAVLTARAVVAPHVNEQQLRRGLKPAEIAVLDNETARGLKPAGIKRIKLWSADGRVVYSDDPGLIGRRFPPSDE